MRRSIRSRCSCPQSRAARSARQRGYIAKLPKRASKRLASFKKDLRLLILKRRVLYWDDTVISILAEQACLRFYGDEKISYYTAHERKDLPGILEDGILDRLTEETYVMHDHNTVNYNDYMVI